MARWGSVAVILLLMGAGGFLALRERPLPQADFTWAMGDEVRTLDPAQTAWNYDIRLALGLWEGLTSYEPRTSAPIEGVAYLPPQVSGDGRTCVFTLRPEARWSNGDKVTTGDFVRGWRRAIEPGTARDYAMLVADHLDGAQDYMAWRNEAVRVLAVLRDLARGRAVSPENRTFLARQAPESRQEQADWAGLAAAFRRKHLAQMEERWARVGVRALDAEHLEVRLVRPTAYFLELTAFSTFLPIHESIELLRERESPEVTDLTLVTYDPQWAKPDYHRRGYPGLITNGPFRLADWQFKRYMLLERNRHYWDVARVPSAHLLVRNMPEPGTAFLAYERGDVDWLDDLTRLDFAPALAEQARQGRRTDIHIVPAFGTYFYWFNCLERLPDGQANPLADRRVRLALTLAVDRRAIVDKVAKMGNPVARNLVPPETIAGYACPPGPDYDTHRARQLLAEAGYPGGAGLPTLEILYNTGYFHDKPAQAIDEMWRRNLGVQVSLRGKELKAFDEDKHNHRFLVIRASWYGDYSDPTTFLDMLVTGNGNNDAAFSNARYDGLIRQAAQCLDPARRLAILAQAEQMLVEQEAPFLPLYYYVNALAYRPEVQGIYPNARNMHPLKYSHRSP